MTKKRVPFYILYALTAYMPFHFYICELFLTKTKADNLVRDFFILWIFFLLFFKKKIQIKSTGLFVALDCFILLLFAISSLISGTNASCVGNSLRTYLVPLLVYFIASSTPLNKKDYIALTKLIVFEFTAIALYGIFQALILGDSFLLKIGYAGDENGHLSGTSYYISGFYGTQRLVGVFISPNICGLLLAFVICILLFSNTIKYIKHRKIYLIVLFFAEILTFSRSALLALIIACCIMYSIKYASHKINSLRVISILLFFCLLLFASYSLDSMLNGGRIWSMLSRSVFGIFNGSDSSASRHMNDLFASFGSMSEYLFGFGFGTNGPIAASVLPQAHLVESSYSLMVFELGVFCGFLFFIPLISSAFNILSKKSLLAPEARAISICALVNFLFLPNIQTYEVIFYIFLYLGINDNIYLSRSVKI